MKQIIAIALIGIAPGLLTTQPVQADVVYQPIDITPFANGRLQGRHPEYPSGTGVLLGDVPFNIPADRLNMWSGADAADGGSGIVGVTIPINLANVAGVHTLINTLWGQSGPTSYAALRFNFSDGTLFVKQLIGDDDIRDYYANTYTNAINGVTTTRVFFTDTDYGSYTNRFRLDKQFIDLSAFSDKTLTSMTVVDRGNENFQRLLFSGLTVQLVPEPATVAMLSLGLAAIGLGRFAAQKRRAGSES